MSDAIQQFKAAMSLYGVVPPEQVCVDGKIHQYGKSKIWWYAYFADGVPAGIFGKWDARDDETWHADLGRQLTEEEVLTHRQRMDAARKERELAIALSVRIANKIWDKAKPVDDHPYLKRKGVQSYGLRVSHKELLIPLKRDDVIISLKFISESGRRRYLPSGQTSGCFYPIGELIDAETICIAETYATAATIHQATGYPVIVAFSASNFKSVTGEIRKAHPRANLVICATDNYRIDGNPGLTKASDAAKLYGAKVLIPLYGAINFNVMATKFGIAAVTCYFQEVSEQINAIAPSQLDAEFDEASANLNQTEIASVAGSVAVAESGLPAFKIFDPFKLVTSLITLIGKLLARVGCFGPIKPDGKDANQSVGGSHE